MKSSILFIGFFCAGVLATPSSTSTATACIASVTPSNLIDNGDFECGLSSWTVDIPDTSARAFIGAPGNTLSHAFEVDLVRASNHTEFGVSARITSDPIPVTFGHNYTLRYWTFFNGPDNGFVGLMINNKPYKTTDARDLGWGAFHFNEFNWTATAPAAEIRFEFLFGPAGSVDTIDTITFLPRT
ncbi:hypothetical protein B0H13DRAFT_1886577 [Mycena leptocephala]|nr:hypothetical protein B0H13DRAFT_2354604 [Mycena leptocephala]KAJ7864368.1 hypothetical protein B0H13DRAFT_1899172 [Mycena leptocephala]KAJ7892985.1 hypothetical protein B0H13DRAFT_1886577 [Mycena leptocephala]